VAVTTGLLSLRSTDVHFSDAEIALVGDLSLSQLGPLAQDHSNWVADDPAAAAFGAALFDDPRLSSSGTIACSSCHQPERGFADGSLPGQGVGNTTRRSMPLAGMAYSPWFFWDGRADSQWAQALGPIENQDEHALSRLALARIVTRFYADQYQAIFGPLPDLQGLPEAAGPLGSPEERLAWDRLKETETASVNTVFANVGKVIAAFERSILPTRGRLDDFADALVSGVSSEALSPLEQRGLKIFVGAGQCIRCHSGPLFTDHFFHNTGVPLATGLPLDLGRLPATAAVSADPFNCLGAFSDAAAGQCGELRFMSTDDSLVRAFKTPSLRAVVRRPPYMHAGQFADLDVVVAHYNAAPWAPVGLTELHRPGLTDDEMAALVAFLKAL
jgi:cytochrome c peroxidase